MGTDYLLIADYIENLKEDGELDRLFPTLLGLMGFQVVARPTDSKGQPQYGKDVIAIGTDEEGKKWRYYFELKGNADKDINDDVLMKRDGIMESLRAAKYTPHNDASIPGFNELPVKYVLVHNGIVMRNTQRTFNGFIEKEFSDKNFERWGIEKLTELFSRYMFSEYFLTDNESVQLLKRTLVLLNSPEYEMQDFFALVRRLLDNEAKVASRSFKKMFASLGLIGNIVIHYCRTENNLKPAKDALNYLVLQTWAWILKHKLERREAVLKRFRSILTLQYELLREYFEKTLLLALEEDGLSAGDGGLYEEIGYPLRALEYLGDLIYFFELRQHYPLLDGVVPPAKKERLEQIHKKCLIELVFQNEGCTKLLLDNHYIPIALLILYFHKCTSLTEGERLALHNFATDIFLNLRNTRRQYQGCPELHNNILLIIEFNATKKRPYNYEDRSSVLITNLLEILILLKGDGNYEGIRGTFLGENKVDLQLAFPNLEEYETVWEEEFFRHNMDDLMYVETSIQLPDKAAEYRKWIKQQPLHELQFRTDKAGLPFLKTLAHAFYKNDVFPWQWRIYL